MGCQRAQGLRAMRTHCCMRCVAFLPEELQGADEWLGAHLPAVDIGPLVDFEREVTVALDPLRKHVIHHRLRCGPHHQRLIQVLATTCKQYQGSAS